MKTIPVEILAKRRARFMAKLGNGVAVLFAAPHALRNADTHYKYRTNSSFYYLTGFEEPDAAAIFAPNTDTPYRLFVPPKDPLRELWDGKRLGVEGALSELKPDSAHPIADFDAEFAKLLKKAGKIFYPIGEMPEVDAKMLKVVSTYRPHARSGDKPVELIGSTAVIIDELRKRKDSFEIDLMRENCRNTALGHVAAMKATKPGMYEYQIEAKINQAFADGGAEALAYGSIVAGGNNATVLHYVTNRDKLNKDDLFLIDAGGEMGLYASDITRTFPVSGKFSPAQRKIYDLVLKAQLEAIDEARVGRPYANMHKKAIDVLTKGLVDLGLLEGPWEDRVKDKTFGKFYPHGTGHWLGLDVHDAGSYFDENGDSILLEPGMVMTVEPGLYFNADDKTIPEEYRGIGIRIEDDILVTESGPENLTKDVPKTASEIEAIVGRG